MTKQHHHPNPDGHDSDPPHPAGTQAGSADQSRPSGQTHPMDQARPTEEAHLTGPGAGDHEELSGTSPGTGVLDDATSHHLQTPDATPHDVEPAEAEQSDVEQSDVEQSDVEQSDVEQRDVEPGEVEPDQDQGPDVEPQESQPHRIVEVTGQELLNVVVPALLEPPPPGHLVLIALTGRALTAAVIVALPDFDELRALMGPALTDEVAPMVPVVDALPLWKEGADTVVAIGYGDHDLDPHLRGVADLAPLPVAGLLRVHDGRWWRLDCPDPNTCTEPACNAAGATLGNHTRRAATSAAPSAAPRAALGGARGDTSSGTGSSAVPEDAGASGDGDPQARTRPVWVVTATEYAQQGDREVHVRDSREDADTLYTQLVEQGRRRVRLWGTTVLAGLPAEQILDYCVRVFLHAEPQEPPLRDSATLTVLDADRPLWEVFDALDWELLSAGVSTLARAHDVPAGPVRNAVRALRLRIPLAQYARGEHHHRREDQEPLATHLRDLLSDLMHLTTLLAPPNTWQHLVTAAERRYRDQLDGNPEEPPGH
jgi:hypothetical protein